MGPEHAFLKDSGRAKYVAVTDTEALEVRGGKGRLGTAPPWLVTRICYDLEILFSPTLACSLGCVHHTFD